MRILYHWIHAQLILWLCEVQCWCSTVPFLYVFIESDLVVTKISATTVIDYIERRCCTEIRGNFCTVWSEHDIFSTKQNFTLVHRIVSSLDLLLGAWNKLFFEVLSTAANMYTAIKYPHIFQSILVHSKFFLRYVKHSASAYSRRLHQN